MWDLPCDSGNGSTLAAGTPRRNEKAPDFFARIAAAWRIVTPNQDIVSFRLNRY
jgi:hypothetical protein